MLPIEISRVEFEEWREGSNGICLACGEIAFGDTEPDAEDCPCKVCGEEKVRGVENALIHGNIRLKDSR